MAASEVKCVGSGLDSIPTNSGSRLQTSQLESEIKQSVMGGSVFLALAGKFFSPMALLNWLVGVTIDDRTCVAYKAICMELHPNRQYLNDNFHFLCKEPAYVGIAINYGLDSDLGNQADPLASNSYPLINYTSETLFKLNATPELKHQLALILGKRVTSDYLLPRLITAYKARTFPKVVVPPALRQQALVMADWIEKFEYKENLSGLILRRIASLQQQAPLYYARIGCKAYYPVIRKLEQEGLLSNLTRDELAMLHSFFPGVIDSRILTYDDLGYKLSCLKPNVAGYVLGFPIDRMQPQSDQIHQAIAKIQSEGIPRYLEANRDYIQSLCLGIDASSSKIVNPDDVLAESIENYVAFDLVIYQQGFHIYRFSRPEFSELLKSKKNHWTGEFLPPTILGTIKTRLKLANTLGFPPARPLPEMLEQIQAGTFFNPNSNDKTSSSSSPSNNPELTIGIMMGQGHSPGAIAWRYI